MATGKYKLLMYMQQLKHLPLKNIDTLVDVIENKLKPEKYAFIVHDKDVDKDGNAEQDHVHVMLKFKNARSLTNIAKVLKDNPQYIEIYDNFNNGLSYLIHATDNAILKHQYSASDVKANFDYVAEIAKIEKSVSKARKSNRIKQLLDALYCGAITRKEIEKELSGSDYGRLRRQIDDIWAKHLQFEAEKWREEMLAQGKAITVIWIFGEAGTGKSSLAKEYAEKQNRPYYVTGSSRDIFQNYSGERTLIMDEFRPKVIPYQDLLRITDPFGSQVMAPSRYNDKALACDLIIITSPFSPLEFYREEFGLNSEFTSFNKISRIDKFEQLNRRISLTLEVTSTEIKGVAYDAIDERFHDIPNSVKPNTFYKPTNHITTTTNSTDLFNSIFD